MAEDIYTVTRSTAINAPAADIYARIVDVAKWKSWSPWEGLDPNMTRTYSNAAEGPGASYGWSGNRKVGEGSMTITGVSADERVDIDLAFLKPFKAENKTWFEIAPSGDSTNVTWTMTGEKTLTTKIMGIFSSMDKMVGKDFEKGLAQLKVEAEAA